MAYSGLPDAGNCVGGISTDRFKVWMAELGIDAERFVDVSGRVKKKSWRWEIWNQESGIKALMSW